VKVWILQTGEPLHIDGEFVRPMRAINLANALIAVGHTVEIWSSDFFHQEKRHRFGCYEEVRISPQLQLNLLPSKGYRRNIGLGRLTDHAQLALNLRRKLRTRIAPDVTFIGYPPIETASVMSKWLKRRDSPSLLDVKDQWPEFFVKILPGFLKPVGRMALFPYFLMASRTFRRVTGISSMASGFLDWSLANAKRPRGESDGVFALTSPEADISVAQHNAARLWWDQNGVFEDDTARFCFVGSQSTAFDFETVIRAAENLTINKVDCEIVICGDGEMSASLAKRVQFVGNVRIVGWIDRPKIEVLAERSIAALAPYRNVQNFSLNIPNKVLDAFSLGIPLVTPLSGEVARLISEHYVGKIYEEGNSDSLAECLQQMIDDEDGTRLMGENAKELYESEFSYKLVYTRLVKHLELLAAQVLE